MEEVRICANCGNELKGSERHLTNPNPQSKIRCFVLLSLFSKDEVGVKP